MKNKFIKKIKRALSGTLASLLLFTGSGITVSAAGNRVIDVGTPISEAGDIVELAFDGSGAITDITKFNTFAEAESDYDSFDRLELGKTYTVTYPNAVDYFGTPLTIKVDAVYSGDFVKYRYENDNGYPVGPSLINSSGNKNRLWVWGRTTKDTTNANIKLTITFYDENGNLFPFTGLYGINDPDEADYLFNTTGRKIYYKDSGYADSINSKAKEYADANGLDTAGKQYLLTTEGFKRQKTYVDANDEGTRYSTINYDGAKFYIELNRESSFELTLNSGGYLAGSIGVPLLYALKTEQYATVKVIDQDTNTTLKTSDTLTGMTDDDVVYDVDANIDEYLKNGYELVSNGVEGQRFDTDTTTDQEFEVILKHKTTTYTPETYKPGEPMNEDTTGTKIPADLELEKTVKRTIKYFIESTEGEKVGEVVEEVKLTRNVTIDNVTGEIVSYGEWIPESPNYSEQVTNELYGYTPDKPVVSETPVLSEDIEEIVIYTPNEQKATIKFVDGEGNSLAEDINITGLTNSTISKTLPEETIGEILENGYSLVSNELEEDATFDNKDDEDQIFTVVFKQLTHTVTFIDGFGETIDVQKNIKHHGSATAPTDPTHEGYVFIGWDVSYNDVTDDITVRALWRPVEITETFTVTFVDGIGNVIKIEKGVMLHGSVLAPENPTREGYTFTGWDVQFDDILQDTLVTATWVKNKADKINVVFLDGFGVMLDTQQINKGDSAKAPKNPTKDGYIFKGWDVSYENLTEDTEVNALWEPKTFKVTFTDGFGEVIKVQEGIMMHGSAETPDTPIKEGYKFKGWDELYNNVTKDMTVNATWEKVPTGKKSVVNTGVKSPILYTTGMIFALSGIAYVMLKKKNN